MTVLLHDLRYAVRTLAKRPGFTLVVVLTLALGIGANTAIFGVVRTVLLKPLAYANPQQLVALGGMVTTGRRTEANVSAPEYRDYRKDLPALTSVAAAWPIDINLTGFGQPQRLQGAVVTANYFRTLGTAPMLGRDFTPRDAAGRIGFVALISWRLWQRSFGGDSAVIGRQVRLDDDPMTIIGVMPRGFRYPLDRGDASMDVWVPVDMDNTSDNFINGRGTRVFEVVGRLKAGVSVAAARSQLQVLGTRMIEAHPESYPAALAWSPTLVPLSERVVGDVRPALLVLMGAVGLVLLIACVNVANLMLTRAAGRQREIAIRAALGSGRGRVVRQLLTESLLVAVVSGALGLGIAVWGTEALGQLARLYLPRAGEIGIDGWVLAFTVLVSVGTGIAFGLVPALHASRTDLESVLRGSSRGAGGRTRAGTRGTLVVTEIAVALMLLTGAGLLLKSFAKLVAVDPGFRSAHLLTFQVWLPWPNNPQNGRFFSQGQRVAFYQRLLEAVRGAPGVHEAALVSILPLRGQQQQVPFVIEGHPLGADEPLPTAQFRVASANYFNVMGIPFLRGEGLSAVADSQASGAVLINATMAKNYFPGENPVGRRIQVFAPQGPEVTIAGVVGDVRQVDLERPAREAIYAPMPLAAGLQMSFVAKVGGDPLSHKAAILAAVHGVDPEQPVFGVESMDQVLRDAGAARRFSLLLLSLFAALAVALSAVGIYSVTAYNTAQRRQEIGLRLALGAVRGRVLRLVVGQGMRQVAMGIVIGAVGSWALSRVLAQQLYQISPRDPATFALGALVLGLVALAANSIPAWRATRLDPVDTLREQ